VSGRPYAAPCRPKGSTFLSLGSQQANSHVHWHVVPLPPGVPFEEQQYAMLDQNDYLSFSDDEACEIAERIRAEFAVPSADQ